MELEKVVADTYDWSEDKTRLYCHIVVVRKFVARQYHYVALVVK